MTDRELERRLADAVSHTAPRDLEGVLSRCEERKGNVIQMTTTKRRPFVRNLIAACLALVILGGGVTWQQAHAVTSIISLDVNPSIELRVNRGERVVECRGLNEEARTVLADMDGGAALANTDLDVAVNAIVGALLRNGYLEEISSAILISVEDKNEERAIRLRQELTSSVDTALQKEAAAASVLSQTVVKSTKLEEKASANNISTGKAALIEMVVALNGALSFEDLAKLSVEELKDLGETGAPGMPIGREAAARAALAYAGLDARDSVYWQVDAELDDVPACYEVEIFYAGQEFEYYVDAYNGMILLRGVADVVAPTDPVTPPVSTTDIGADSAKLAALGHAGLTEGQVTGLLVERDVDDGRLEYEVEFFVGNTEYDFTVDGATGAVLKAEMDVEETVPAVRPTKPVAPGGTDIGIEAAKQVALDHAGLTASQVTRLHAQQDDDDGRLEYEVEFVSGGIEYEYSIDGATGAVLEYEKDRAD